MWAEQNKVEFFGASNRGCAKPLGVLYSTGKGRAGLWLWGMLAAGGSWRETKQNLINKYLLPSSILLWSFPLAELKGKPQAKSLWLNWPPTTGWSRQELRMGLVRMGNTPDTTANTFFKNLRWQFLSSKTKPMDYLPWLKLLKAQLVLCVLPLVSFLFLLFFNSFFFFF